MKGSRALAHDLAAAGFRQAEADGTTAATGKALDRAAEVLREHPRLRQVLLHPHLSAAQRDAGLALLGTLTGAARGVLGALVTRRRLDAATAVARGFAAMQAARAAVVPVRVETAAALGRADAARLKDVLERGLGRKVSLAVTLRRSLLGGLRIRAGELVIDGSVAGAFDRLEQALVPGSLS